MTTSEHQKHEDAEKATSGRDHRAGYGHDKPQNQNLEDLKNEILKSINGRRRAPLAWGSVTVSVTLGLLALISLVQAAQSVSLYNQLKSGDLKPAAAGPAAGPAGGSGSSLPSQVGGC